MKRSQRLSSLLTATALLIGGVVAAPAANAAPGDRELVDGWYGDFLGREADPGSAYWVNRLSGQQPSDVLWSIAHSEEYATLTIDIYYRYLLNRSPEGDRGARYWVNGITQQRFPEEWALQNILASPEFAGRKDTRTIINGWYELALDRGPTDGEARYWAQRRSAVGALGAVRELYYTPEAVQLRVEQAYSFLLEREPGASEVAYWYDKEVENSVNVSVLIGSTPEYRTLVTG